MVVSRWWARITILTFLAGFTVLGLMAYKIHTEHPPVPQNVVSKDGRVMFTGKDSLENRYWHARTPELFQQPLVAVLEWARLPGDVLFIVGGIVPVVYLAVRMFEQRNRAVPRETGERPGEFATRSL